MNFIPQLTSASCGMACLKMLLAIVHKDEGYLYLNEDENVALICNEEGKCIGLPLNRDIGHDIIAGNFILVGDDGCGEDLSLTDEQIEKYKKRFDKESIKETDIAVGKIALSNSLGL